MYTSACTPFWNCSNTLNSINNNNKYHIQVVCKQSDLHCPITINKCRHIVPSEKWAEQSPKILPGKLPQLHKNCTKIIFEKKVGFNLKKKKTPLADGASEGISYNYVGAYNVVPFNAGAKWGQKRWRSKSQKCHSTSRPFHSSFSIFSFVYGFMYVVLFSICNVNNQTSVVTGPSVEPGVFQVEPGVKLAKIF